MESVRMEITHRTKVHRKREYCKIGFLSHLFIPSREMRMVRFTYENGNNEHFKGEILHKDTNEWKEVFRNEDLGIEMYFPIGIKTEEELDERSEVFVRKGMEYVVKMYS